MTDFFTWWLDHKDCYFDIRLKSKAIEDEDGHILEFFKIVECVELPDKDIWLGCRNCWVENNDIKTAIDIQYYKLSEINLADYTELFLKELTD